MDYLNLVITVSKTNRTTEHYSVRINPNNSNYLESIRKLEQYFRNNYERIIESESSSDPNILRNILGVKDFKAIIF